jgi:hypothetical protein
MMNGRVVLLVCLALLGGGLSPARATPFVQQALSPPSASLSGKERVDGAWLWDFLHPWCGLRTTPVDCGTGSTLLAGSSEATPAGMGTSISARPTDRADGAAVADSFDLGRMLLELLGWSNSRLPAVLLRVAPPEDRIQSAVILETANSPCSSDLWAYSSPSLTVRRFSSRLYRPPRVLTWLLVS